MVATFKAAPTRVTATKTKVDLRVAKQTWLEQKHIETVRFLSKETGLTYFEQTGRVFRQGQMMSAKGIVRFRPNVPFDILVDNLTNIPVHAPMHTLLCAPSDSMVDIIDSGKVGKNVAIR